MVDMACPQRALAAGTLSRSSPRASPARSAARGGVPPRQPSTARLPQDPQHSPQPQSMLHSSGRGLQDRGVGPLGTARGRPRAPLLCGLTTPVRTLQRSTASALSERSLRRSAPTPRSSSATPTESRRQEAPLRCQRRSAPVIDVPPPPRHSPPLVSPPPALEARQERPWDWRAPAGSDEQWSSRPARPSEASAWSSSAHSAVGDSRSQRPSEASMSSITDPLGSPAAPSEASTAVSTSQPPTPQGAGAGGGAPLSPKRCLRAGLGQGVPRSGRGNAGHSSAKRLQDESLKLVLEKPQSKRNASPRAESAFPQRGRQTGRPQAGFGPTGKRCPSWEPVAWSPRGPPPPRYVASSTRPLDRASSSSALSGRKDHAESPSPQALGPQTRALQNITNIVAGGADEHGAAKCGLRHPLNCKGRNQRHTVSEPQLPPPHGPMPVQFKVPEPELPSKGGLTTESHYVPPITRLPYRVPNREPLGLFRSHPTTASTSDAASTLEALDPSASPPPVRSDSAMEHSQFPGCKSKGPPSRPVRGMPVHRQSSAPPLRRQTMPAEEATMGAIASSGAMVSCASVFSLAASSAQIQRQSSDAGILGRPRANTQFVDVAEVLTATEAAPSVVTREHPLPPGGWALRTIDDRLVSLMFQWSDRATQGDEDAHAKLRALEPSREKLGTWMAWMVCRLRANDPELKDLNFTCMSMPAPEQEPRIMRTLVSTLGGNTHLRTLQLSDSNLRGSAEAQRLAESLRVNRTLRVLNIESNALEPADLQCIIEALSSNRALVELRCSNQFAAPAGRDVFEAAVRTLRANRVLCVLGMDILDRHYLDLINRALIENVDSRRQRRVRSGSRHRRPEDDDESDDGNIDDARAVAAALRAITNSWA